MAQSFIHFFQKRYILAVIGLFAIILFIRTLPELLIGPTPVGYDSSHAYLLSYIFYKGSLLEALKNFNLFYFYLQLFHKAGIDGLTVIKVTGPLLFTLLCGSFFLILKDVFHYRRRFILLGTFLFALNLCTLRLSWDLYRNELGLLFAFLCIWLVSRYQEQKNLWYLPLIILTAMGVLGSHQMVSFLLAAVAVLSLISASIPKKPAWKWAYWLIAAVIVIGWPLIAPSIHIRGLSLWQDLVLQHPHDYLLPISLFKLLFYPFFGLFALLGIFKGPRRPLLLLITLFILTQSAATIFFRTGGFFLWDRWTYFLGAPLVIYALEGLILAVRWIGPRIRIHQAYLTLFLASLIIAPSIQFLWPQRTLYGASVNRTVFNIIPGSILSNAFIANSFERDRARNLLPCLALLRDKAMPLPILYPQNYQGILYYELPEAMRTNKLRVNTSELPPPYYVITYTPDEWLIPAFASSPDCPIYLQLATP